MTDFPRGAPLREANEAATGRGSGRGSRVARGGARSLLFRIITAGTDALVLVVTARGFGAEGRGIYALASFAASLMVTVLGGTTASLSAEYAHGRSQSGRLHAAAFVISAIGGGLIALIVGVFSAVTWPDYQALAYAAAVTPFTLLVDYQIVLYLAEGDVRRMHYLYLARSVLPLVALGAVAVAAPGDIYLALFVWACSRAVLGIGALGLQHRHTPLLWSRMRDLTSRLMKRGAPVSLGNGIARLNYRVDLLVVAALLPLAEVGIYSIAIALGEVLWLLSRAVMTGAYNRIVTAESASESVRMSLRAFRHSLGLQVVAGLALLVPAKFLMVPIFGERFEDAWGALALLLPGVVMLGVVEVLREFFLVRLERSREYLIMATAALVLNLVLALALVPLLGLAGAALSTSLSYLAAGAYLLVRFARVGGGPRDPRAYLPGAAELNDYRGLVSSLLENRIRLPWRP